MNSFEDKVKQSQDVAEIFLKLTDEQRDKIHSQILGMKIENEFGSGSNAKKELESLIKILKSSSEEQKLEMLQYMKKLKEEERSNSNVSIKLKLDL